MTAELNHTIVYCKDKSVSAPFLAEILGRPAPVAFPPFMVVALDNGVSLDFMDASEPIASQHYAFLIGEVDFDAVFARIQAKELEHWADPGRRHAGEINHRQGGRGVYFTDPNGHLLEVLTRGHADD
jgi:catechol 2,3-dioxygenase-like lactoylglutathione lyase family enzyme